MIIVFESRPLRINIIGGKATITFFHIFWTQRLSLLGTIVSGHMSNMPDTYYTYISIYLQPKYFRCLTMFSNNWLIEFYF